MKTARFFWYFAGLMLYYIDVENGDFLLFRYYITVQTLVFR